jgi:hypothetical protein
MPVGISQTYISGISTVVDSTDAAYKEYVDNENLAPIPDVNVDYPFLLNTGTDTAWVGISSFVEYTTGGTYNITLPTYAKELTVVLTGGGGGGAGGISGPSNNFGNDVGGGAGGGGGSVMFSIPTSAIVGTALTVIVGLAGTGGNGSPGSSTVATAGANGGRTTIIWNSLEGTQSVFANGGTGGSIGVHASSGGAGGPGGTVSVISNYTYSYSGTAGGRGAFAGSFPSAPAFSGGNASAGYQCSGGGGGGANAGSSLSPGSGGAIYFYSNTYQITTNNASAVTISGLSYGAGAAGGTGGTFTGSPGGSGARGGGGGGGGGGQGQNLGFPAAGYTSGNGGSGGTGYALVMWRG